MNTTKPLAKCARPLFGALLTALAASFLVACATPVAEPVFYPNATYQKVGAEQAQADSKACSELAAQTKVGAVNSGDVMSSGAKGAVGGATAGAVGSVLSGRRFDLSNVGALAGAIGAGSAAATATGQSISGSPLYRQFMHRCLSAKGYEVIGWK
jgi:outer membrane lipoprotein SlyB